MYSDTFAQFAEPLMEGNLALPARQRCFEFAMLAWNLAMLPPHKRIPALLDMLQDFPIEDRAELKQEMQVWVERKLQQFGTCQWVIDRFELRETADTWHLTVLARVLGQPGACEV